METARDSWRLVEIHWRYVRDYWRYIGDNTRETGDWRLEARNHGLGLGTRDQRLERGLTMLGLFIVQIIPNPRSHPKISG